jgi:predicted amidohydrolase YtcJ
MSDWRHLDALLELRAAGPLPTRVKVLVASGLAERTGPTLRRTGDDAVEVIGVKLYADGWLGPRTCALCRPFDDTGGDGVLFLDADALARRAAPFAEAGWMIATHAIGDRAVAAVLDGYEQVYGDDCRTAAPRIEHAQVLSHELIARMAELGVVACIQPSFATSDAATAVAALGDRVEASYRWDRLLAAGVRVIAGSDFPIETLDPRVGLQRLVEGCAISPALPFDAALAMMTDAAEGTTRWDRHPGAAGGTDAASIPVVALPA